MIPIQLIIGLGNPGAGYADTRHNAGIWFIEALADYYGQTLKPDTKHKGLTAAINENNRLVRLFIPHSYMNICGLPIKAIANFYKMPPESLLIAHDELDFPPGVVKLKKGGGHAGHNGLRDIICHLHSHEFYRLRLGIGHPGHRDCVSDYVLHRPSVTDKIAIDRAIDQGIDQLRSLLNEV